MLKRFVLEKILGYLGLIPFVLLSALLLWTQDYAFLQTFGILQLFYAGMILSFLAGIHWPFAIRNNNIIQLCLSMLPTILCLLLFAALLSIAMAQFSGLAIYTQYFYSASFLIMMALFWFVYGMDRTYLKAEDFWEGYFCFRRHLNFVVSLCLIASAAYFCLL